MTNQFAEPQPKRSVPMQFLSIYAHETRAEFLKLLRAPIYSVFVIGFPLLFFLVFGLPSKGGQFEGYSFTRYLVATYSSFGALAAALFAIGAGIAQERGFGWLELKRASAMPPTAYIFAKLVVATFFGVLVTACLLLLAHLTMDPQISFAQGLRLMAAIAVSMIVYATLGIALGLSLPATSAPGTINFIYLPLSLFAGLWVPLDLLPTWIQGFGRWLPTFYSSHFALRSLGYLKGSGSATGDLLIMLLYSLAFVIAAIVLFRRQEAAS